MANFGLIFKQRVRVGLGASEETLPVGAVELDVSLDEMHKSANEVTAYPVEKGVDITDHVRRQRDQVTVRGVITDHPIFLADRLLTGFDRSLEAHDRVLQILRDAELITVVTSLREYDNMILESVEVPRDSSRGHSVESRSSAARAGG